jgi:L-alanine-DL-glutamate epimerase-like enolase superfamily enzyme
MKIESVEAYPMSIKAREDLKGGAFSYSHYQTVLVKVVADGVEGWGESMTRFEPEVTALTVRFLANKVKGKQVSVESAWQNLWKELRIRGHTRGTDVEALSGLEIALRDCQGKLAKKPLGLLFSRRTRKEVPAFAGSLFASRGSLEDQVERAQGLGLRGAKVKVGFGVDKDVSLLSRVRKAWPEAMLVADANGAYDSKEAAKACRAFSGLELAWFEEPVPSDDLEGYESLKGLGTKVGGGESWFPGDFDAPMDRRLVDVVEPSVSRCGGVKVEMDVARRAAALGIAFSPMTGMNSAISLAASVHASAAFDSVGVEFNPFDNPLQTELADGLKGPIGGMLSVPTGDGLGISVDEKFVRKHSRRPVS